MRYGKFLLFDLGAANPTIACTSTDNWPAGDVFNYENWNDEKVYRTILKDGEDVDKMEDDYYFRTPSFAMALMVKNDEACDKLIRTLPDAKDFKKINIV